MCARPLRRILAVTGIAAMLGSGCHVAGAKVWNLEQVHHPDGSAKRRGRVQTDLGFVFGNALRSSNFGGEDFREEQEREKRVKDPLGVCLENLIELGRCRPDQKVAGLQAGAFSWLAIDCDYMLSRERSVLELGDLARRLELQKQMGRAPEIPAQPATPELVKELFEGLVSTMREVVAAPDLAGNSLDQRCQAVRSAALDRAGALRLLRTTNALLVRGEQGAVFEPLRELRLHLARLVVGLALREARADAHGLVRAAALKAGVQAFPEERAELLRWGLNEPMDGVPAGEEVSLRALQLLAEYGPPTPKAGQDAEGERRRWIEDVLQFLRIHADGRHTTAACHALAKASGEPEDLRPEVWILRWQEAAAPTATSRATP